MAPPPERRAQRRCGRGSSAPGAVTDSLGPVLQERWLEEDAEFWKGPANGAAPGDKGAEAVRGRRYLPFGDGVRSCVGQSLAKMNYTAALALLLSHFTFRLADRVSACAHRCHAQTRSRCYAELAR